MLFAEIPSECFCLLSYLDYSSIFMFLKIEGDEYRREWKEERGHYSSCFCYFFFSFWRITEAVNISFWNAFSLLALVKTSTDSFYLLSSPWNLRLLWGSGYTNRIFTLANCTYCCWGASEDWRRNRQEHWVKIGTPEKIMGTWSVFWELFTVQNQK